MNKVRPFPILLLLAILLPVSFAACRSQSAEETATPTAPAQAATTTAIVPTSTMTAEPASLSTVEPESTFIPVSDDQEPEATEATATSPPDPSALAAVIVSGDFAGTGKPFAFDATQSQPGDTSIVAYEWDMGDGTFLFGLTVEYVFMEAGSYTVTLTVIDEDGQKASTSKEVEVEDLVDNILPTEEGEYALDGTSWQMDNAIRGTTVTMAFSEETVSGSSGCNSYNASYVTSEINDISIGITVSAISSTSKSCTLEIMAQERGYLESLDSAESYTIEGTTLILETGSGTLTYSLVSN